MAQFFHTLKHEHRVIERAMRALDGVSARLRLGQRVSADALLLLVDFISIFADRYHHDKEERCLFPALEKQGFAHEEGPLTLLKRQHEIERELTAEMKRAIENFKEDDDTAKRNFIEAARRYSSHLTNHMEAEEAIMFRIADEMLDDSEKESIAAAFRGAEAEFGAHMLEKYERMATELEESWVI
jgi:hemerythrin-like domain-containing protein